MTLRTILAVAILTLGCAGPVVPLPGPEPAPEPPPEPVVAAPVPAPPPPPEPEPEPWELVPEGEIALVAVVGGGRAWVSRSCSMREPIAPEDSAAPRWASLPLVLLSLGGLQPFTGLEPPVCEGHACGSDQVAFPVTGGGDGVLLRSDPRAPAVEPLTHLPADEAAPDCPRLPRAEEPGAPVEACTTWVGSHRSRALQVHTTGVMGEDERTDYRTIEARLVRREGDGWVPGAWAPLEDPYEPPSPLAWTTGPSTQVVWTTGPGASGSTAWISTPDHPSSIGHRVWGEFGLDCD